MQYARVVASLCPNFVFRKVRAICTAAALSGDSLLGTTVEYAIRVGSIRFCWRKKMT